MSNAIRMTQEQFEAAQRRNKAVAGRECPEQPKKRQKYGNVAMTDAEGVKHASKKQAQRYTELGYRMKAGEIVLLAREVRFRLPGGVEYRADHITATPKGMEAIAELVAAGEIVIEDVKSEATKKDKVYRMKRKQMKECLGVEILEI